MTPRHPRYFHHLNYSLGNEDSEVEYTALPERAERVLCVAGSGSRVLPLLARRPSQVVCVDVSPEQLHLTELRIQAARTLTHREYLQFFGYPPGLMAPEQRRRLFERIPLSDPTRACFLDIFDHRSWESILYDGRWERTFRKLAQVNGMLTRSAGRGLFRGKTQQQHQAYLDTCFPRKAWLLTLLLLGNPLVFNLMLYKGDFPRKNVPGTPFGFYRETFDRLFALGPAGKTSFCKSSSSDASSTRKETRSSAGPTCSVASRMH